MKLRLPHKFQAALIAALASVSFTTLSTGAAYAEESPLTFEADLGDVMYVGDSITHGIAAASWRWSMHKILVDNGISYDENGYNTGNDSKYSGGLEPGTPYGGVAFENVHSAHSGGDAYEVIGRKQRSGGHYGNTNIYNWLGIDTDLTVRNGTPDTYTYPVTDHVDTFLMLIGTNDMLSSGNNPEAIAGTASNALVQDISDIYGVMQDSNRDSQLVLLSIPTWGTHANNNTTESHQAVAAANAKVKAWADKQANVTYVDVNTGLIDVSSTSIQLKGVDSFYRAPGTSGNSDGLHPNAQGELIIAGNVAQAMGYAGRSVGLERSSAAEPAGVVWTTPITEQTTITAGAAAQTVASGVFTVKDGYTVDFNAVYGNGGTDGTWDNANAFSITVGDGTHSGTLSLTEAYVKWDNKILYSKNNSVAGDNLRIAYVNASAYSADNVSAGYYVWLGDQLIGEALTAGSASAGFNGVSLQATGANATVSTLSWTNYAYAPTTEGYVNEDAAFKLAQTYPMPGHDANPAHIKDFNYETARKETSDTIGSGFFGAVGSGTATSDTQVVYTLESQTGANAFGAVNASSDANIAAVFGGGGTVASGSYTAAESAAFMGAYSGSIAGKLSVEMNDITFAGNVIMGLVTNGTTRTVGSTELIVNAGARIQGNVYGGHGVKAQGTITGGTRIEVTGGTITGSIYGGNEAGSGGSVAGGSEILISGGVIKGSVLGGTAGGTFTGTTSVTVDGNLASIGGNIEADTVTLKNVASNTQGYTDGFDYYQGTIRAPRVELVDFTVERFMANIETQSLVLSGGSNTTLTNLTLTACDIDAQGISTVTLDGTLSLGETTTYSGSVALADGLAIDMAGGDFTPNGEYSEGNSGYMMGSRDVMKLADDAAAGSALNVHAEALVGAGALAGNTFSYDSATGTLTATGADRSTFYVNAGDSLQYSAPVEENPVYGATGIAMNGGSLEFVEALKNGVTLGVTADGSRIIVNDGVDMAVKEITLSTLESHALTLSGTMTASTAAEITANLIGGNANITTTGNISLSNGATSHAGGVLTVGARLNFSLNSGRDHTYNISSFKQIVLESGSAINYHGGTGTFNNVTLADGDASISITDMANSSMLTLAGETQLNGHRLSITVPTGGSWKRFVTIEKLVGDADSTLYFEGGKTNDGSGSHLTINSLQGFSGTLELKENNSNNPLIATVGTGSGSAVNLKALNLTGSGEEVTLSGNAPLSIGSLAMSQASSLTAGSLTVGALSGAGSLNITGDLAINGQSGDSTHSGNVKVLGEVTKSGAGSQTLGGGTLAFLDKITVEGGTLNIGTADSTATYAGTISNSGVLGLNGTIALSSANLSAFTQVEDSATTTTYSGTGDFEGSGYMQSSAEYYLVKGSGTVSGTYAIDEATGSLVSEKSTGGNVVVTFKSSDNTGLYYVNKTLNYDAATMGTASGFVIASNAALNSDGSSYAGAPKVLHGEGTYALKDGTVTLNTGLTLGTDWTGTVRITDATVAKSAVNFGDLVNGTQSTIELKGFSGYTTTWYQGSGSGVHTQNLKLTNGSSGYAWKSTGSTGNDGNTAIFSGTWSGDGVFQTEGNKLNFRYEGDISAWTGAFHVNSSSNATIPTLTFAKQATVVNAAIEKGNAYLNVAVDTDVQFNKAITADTFTVNAGRTATLAPAASNVAYTIGTITNNGTIAVAADKAASFTASGNLNFGNIIMDNGATLNFNHGAEGREHTFSSIALTDGATATINIINNSWCARFNIGALTGAAGTTLNLWSAAKVNKATVYDMNGGEGSAFYGNVVVSQQQTGGTRYIAMNINSGAAEQLRNSVVTLSSNASCADPRVGLGINADSVVVKGIVSDPNATSGTHYIFSGAAERTTTSFDDIGDGKDRTLTIDTGSSTDSYSTRAKVGSHLSLVKDGTGTQAFTGDLSAMDGTVTVNAGKLTLANSAASAGRLASITVEDGTLQLSKMNVAEASSLSGGALEINGTVAMSGALEQTGGTLSVVSGGDLTLSAGGTLSSTVTNAGSLTLGGTINLGGGREDYALFAEGEDTYSGEEEYVGSGFILSSTDQYYLVKDNGGTLTVSEGFALTGGQRMTESVDPAKTIGANDFVFQFDNAGPVGGTYYVNKSLTYNADEMGEADALSIKEDATLTVDAPATIKAITGGGSLVNNAALTLGGAANAVFAGTVSGSGDIEKVGNGTQTVNGNMEGFSGGINVTAGTLDIDVTQTRGSITTHAVTVAEGATLNLAAGGDGGQLFANGTMHNDGNLSLGAIVLVLNPDNYTAYEVYAGDKKYTGTGNAEGSGYLNADARYYLVKGGENSTVSSLFMDCTGGTYLAPSVGDKDVLVKLDISEHAGTYYVNDNMNTHDDVKESQYDILRASDIVIEEGVTLTAYTVNDTFTDAKLHGEGTYALANKRSALNTGLSLGDDWAGTVLVTNAADVANLGTTIQDLTQGDSWVELRNVNGTLGGDNTYSGNIILTDNGSATAMRITTSTSGTTTHLTGDIKGNGTIERRVANGNTLYFDGDLSGWTGGYYNGGKDGSFSSGNNTLYFTHGGEINADFVNRARANNCYLTLNFQADTIVNSDLYTEPGAGQTAVQALNIGVTANATFNGNVTATNLRGSATSSVVVGKDATMTLIATERNYSQVSDLDNQGVLSIKANGGDIRFYGKSDDQVFNLGNFVIDGDTGTSYLLTAGTGNYTTDIAVKKLTGGGAGHTLQVTTCYTGGGTNEGKVIDFIIGDEESPATAATYTGTIQYGTGSGSVKGGAGMNVLLKDEYVAANAVLQTTMSGGTYATVTVDTERAKVKGLKDATTGKTVNVSGTAADKNRVLEIVGNDDYTYNGKLGANLDVVHSGNGTQSFGGVDGFNGSIDVEAGVLNIMNAASVSPADVTIGANGTLGVYTNTTAAEANVGTLTITDGHNLTAGGAGAKLNANLVMEAGSTLDVSAYGGMGGLNMGCTVTLNPGMSLSTKDMEGVAGLGFMEAYDLHYDVESFSIGTQQYSEITFASETWVKASEIFDNTELGAKDYYVFYSGVNPGGNGGNVGTIYIVQLPEPTTGTLSLLALAALAARRRRK